MSQNNSVIGITYMLGGMFSLGINDILVKILANTYPVWEIIFFRAFSGVIISFLLVSFFGWKKLYTKKPLIHVVRALSSVGCVVLFFFGIKFLLLAENQAIFHISPIIAALLAIAILSERISMHRIFAILIGFIGVIVILKPGTGLFNVYSLIPLLSAFFMSLAYLSTRYLMSTDSSISIIFYYSLALFFVSLFFWPSDFSIPSFIDLIPLMGLGVFGSLGHYFLSQAGKNADVTVIAPFEYTNLFFVAFMGYLFFNEIPDTAIYIGSLFIIISGLYIVYSEKRKKLFEIN